METALEHNQILQQHGLFSASDLEANRRGLYSESQRKRFESERNFLKQNAAKYDNKQPVIRLIFGMGFIVFLAAIYFTGAFEMIGNALGSLFLPVMVAALAGAVLLIVVVIPRQYQASVDTYKTMGTPLDESPLAPIQTIQARAEVYTSQRGMDRLGRQSPHVSHVLQMDSIKFLIHESLRQVIQPNRAYRVYAVNDQGTWVLLSMETDE